jgi:hypothetical protein
MLRFATLVSLLLASTVLAACGSSGGASDADPASAVPRDALFYLEATVRPEGELREDALAATGKILRTPDPEAKIRELIAEASEGEDFDYDRDVKPWLGERAGLWVSDRLGDDGDPGVAAAIAATDLEEAEGAIEEARKRDGDTVTERSHGGVDYKLDQEGFGYAFTQDFVLFGNEPELKRTIDALDGDSLADEDRYKDAIGRLDDGRLAHFYADTRKFFEFATKSDPESAESIEPLKALIPFDRLPPATGAFIADGSRLALDMGVEIPEGDDDVRERLGAFVGGSTALLEELPGDTWAAQGMPRAGETMRVLLDEVGGAFGGAAARRQFEQELGLSLDDDILSWIGDVAIFVRGETLDTLDGGAVIQVTDENAAADAFGRIVGALRARGQLDAQPARIDGAETAFTVAAGDAAKPIVIARGAGKVVVTYGAEAATAALKPSEKLGDSELFGRAEEVLGDDVEASFLLSLAPVVSLVESSGEAGAEWQQAKPYVEAFDIVAGGGGADGDHARARVAAGLR